MASAEATPSLSVTYPMTVVDLVLVLACGCALYYGVPSLRRRLPWILRARVADREGLTVASMRTLRDWAFDYERELLERPELSREQHRLIASLLTEVILPLMGHVSLGSVDNELERAVAAVLRVQVGWLRADYAVAIWHSFLNWSREHAGLQASRASQHPPAQRLLR